MLYSVQEYVALQESWEERKRLLHFARHGAKAKRSGVRGDQEIPSAQHTEL